MSNGTEVSVWRIAAEGDCDHLLSVPDENFLFAAVKPGDAFLLLDSVGEKAWRARRVFLVRRETGRSIGKSGVTPFWEVR